MKWNSIFFLFFSTICLGYSHSLYSLNSDSLKSLPNNNSKPIIVIVKTDLFWPAIRFRSQQYAFSVTVERPIAKRHSIQLTYFDEHWDFKFGDPNGNRYSEEKRHYFSIIPQYKFYVRKKKQCSGYYLGASLMFMHDQSSSEMKYPASATDPARHSYYAEASNSWGGGFFNGVQLYLFKRLTVDIQAGMIIYNEYYLGESEGLDFFPLLAFNIGYKF